MVSVESLALRPDPNDNVAIARQCPVGVRVAALDAIHEVFTDAAPPAPEAQRLRESDVVLHIAEAA